MYYYSIFDLKSRTFGDLISLPSEKDASAIRWLMMVMTQETKNPSLMQKYPQDFELHYVGKYDQETGEFDQSEKRFVCSVEDVIEKEEEVSDAQA